ncbi:MAG: stage II sporulation protein D [Ruminococcaceae bacterium]|nr:stage II sporulation protein D [Oscillospiraceae bacterium]
MKHEIRISALLLALLWLLAWTSALHAAAPEPEEPSEEPALQPVAQNQSAETPQRGVGDAETALRVLHGGQIEEMTMDKYLVGVLRAEMPASFEPEALKAQAIAARTYTLYKMREGVIENHPDADACDDIRCCKAYMTAEDAAADWGGMALYYEEKLARAVAETDAQVVLYGGEPILAVFCSSTNGHTQNAGAVWQSDLPYLQSVSSPETEELVPNYYSVETVPAERFRALLTDAHPDADLSGAPQDWITDIERSDAGFVTALRAGGVRLKGNELRAILGLRSPSFTVEADDDALTFRVTGYGHGVGMSQYGANALAMQGMDASQILEHYFTGAHVGYLP